jgi:hypothetical protein
MKKLLAILVLLGAAFAAYVFVIRPPEKRGCTHVADLCGFSAGGPETQRCLETLDALKSSNATAVSSFTTCAGKASSCAEAMGCASGAALEMGTGFVKDFVSGFAKYAK